MFSELQKRAFNLWNRVAQHIMQNVCNYCRLFLFSFELILTKNVMTELC